MKQTEQIIQVDEKEIKKMSGLMQCAESDLMQLADLVLRNIYGESHEYKIKSLRVVPGNTRTAILDSRTRVIGVWEDPPGICRRPRKNEKFD